MNINEIISQVPWGLTANAASLLVIVWWIRGMADRKRAENEKIQTETKVTESQYNRLEREIERLTARVVTLEKTVAIKDTTIADLIALKLQTLAESAAERVLATARDAENKTIIANLMARLAEHEPLVVATEHMAKATDRVADAAEKAVR